MMPTDVLMQEHRVIERMLNILNNAADSVEKGEDVPMTVFEEAIDFIRNFADKWHHSKEEDMLYPAMERRGVPAHGGPIGVMLVEHDMGRKFVSGMAAAVERYKKGDEGAKEAIVENARGYASLLGEHIPKEDTILYPMANQVLSPKDNGELMERFEKVEKEMGEDVHHRYEALVKKLENNVR